MTYEELIVAIDGEAPKLSHVALRLLLRLVSLAIQQGVAEVRASDNWLAQHLGISREGVARATRDLAKLITVDRRNGCATIFLLPADWFTPQRSLFAGRDLPANIHNLPTFQAGDGQLSRHVPAKSPGRTCQVFRQDLPTFQAPPANSLGSTCQVSRQDLPTLQAGTPISPIRTAGARVNRSISSSAEPEGLTGFIDRCLRTVKILPAQEEDAQILSDTLQHYRTACGSDYAYTPEPDETVLARILAIAPIEDLCGVLRTLLTDGVRCGKQDMWFFTVLLQRIHRASPKLTASRYDSMKPKAPSQNENLPGFADELINGTMPKLRRLA